MKKIYNNLTKENLMKTEYFNHWHWFKQFNREQKKEILKGIEDNLDFFIYAKNTHQLNI